MLGSRTGQLQVRPNPKKQFELYLSEGAIFCFKEDGFSVCDPAGPRRGVTSLLKLQRGGFGFNQVPVTDLEHHVDIGRQTVFELSAALGADPGSADQTEGSLDLKTRFRLKEGSEDFEVPDNLAVFLRRAHAQLAAGCSAEELAVTLALHPSVVKLYLLRLRTLDKVAPVRAYAANYKGYSAASPAAAVPAVASFTTATTTTTTTAATVLAPEPAARSPKEPHPPFALGIFVRRKIVHQPLKIVVSGPVGAGKTSFIRSLSVIDVIETEELASEDIGKERTTVAFDFGIMSAEDTVIHLYGTPGQDRFDFMWEVLCEGALGLILLVPGDRPHDYPHARNILEFVTSRIPVPFIVGVTRQDLGRVWEPEDVASYFDLELGNVVGVNATQQGSAREAVAALLHAIEREAEASPESAYSPAGVPAY